MAISRRQILSGAGAAGVGAAALTAPPAAAQSAPATAGSHGTPSIEQRVLSRALQSVFPMTFDGVRVGGPGWDLLERESRASEFVLLGEEHGMVETPRLARQLFLALRSEGFDTLAIEISPPAAQDFDRAARGGLAGISAYIAAYPPGPPFYFWASEADLIAAAARPFPGSGMSCGGWTMRSPKTGGSSSGFTPRRQPRPASHWLG